MFKRLSDKLRHHPVSLITLLLAVSDSATSDSNDDDDVDDDVSVSSSSANKSDVLLKCDDSSGGGVPGSSAATASGGEGAPFDKLVQIDAKNKDFDILKQLDVDDVDVDSESLEREIEQSDKIPFMSECSCATSLIIIMFGDVKHNVRYVRRFAIFRLRRTLKCCIMSCCVLMCSF